MKTLFVIFAVICCITAFSTQATATENQVHHNQNDEQQKPTVEHSRANKNFPDNAYHVIADREAVTRSVIRIDKILNFENKTSNKQYFPTTPGYNKPKVGNEKNTSNDMSIKNMSKEKVNSVLPANEKQTWKSNVLLYQLMNGKQTCGNGKLKVKTNDSRPILRQKVKRLRREINTGEQEVKQRKKGKPIYKNFETNQKTKRRVYHLSDGKNVKKIRSSDKSCRFHGKCKKRKIHANKKHTIVSKKFHRYKHHGNDDKKMHNGPPSNDKTQQKGKISKDSTKHQRKANSSKTNQDVNDSYKMHGKYKKTTHKSRYSSNKFKKYGELSDNKDRNFHLENSNITKIEHGIQDGKETIATTRQSNIKTNVFNETSKNGFLNPSKSKKLGEEKRIDLDNKLNDYELDKGDDLDHFENHTPPINRVRTLSKDSSDAEYIDKMETRPDSSGYEKSTNHTNIEMKTFSKAVDDESADSKRWIPPELQLEDDKSTESVNADDQSQPKPLNIENSSEREKSETTMREKTRFLDQIDNGNEANDLLDNAMNNQINNAVDTKDVGYIDILKIPSLKEVITPQISQDESSSDINSLTSVDQKTELIERLLKKAEATSRAKNEFPEIHDDLENDEMELLNAISDLIKKPAELLDQNSSHATRTRRSTENLEELLPRLMNDDTLDTEKKSSNKQHFPPICSHEKRNLGHEINISHDMPITNMSKEKENSVHPANEKQTWKSNVLLYQLMNGKQTCGNGKLKVKTNDSRPIFRQIVKRLRREINTGEQEVKQRKKGKPIYKNFETNEKTKRRVYHLSDGRNVKKMRSSDKSCRFHGKCKKRKIHANKKHTIVSKKFHRYKQHGNDDKKMHNGPPSNDNTQQKGKISKDSTKYQRKANSSKTNQDVNDSYKMHGKYKKTIHKSRYSSNKHKKYGELSDNKDRNFHLENSNITKIEHGIQDGKETIATTRQSNNKTNVFNETSKNGFLNPSKSKKLGEEKRIDLDNKLNDYELDKGDDLDHFENHTPPINRVRTLSKDSSDAEYIDKMETRPDSSGYEKSTNHTHTEMKTFSKAVDDESADSERWIPPELQLEDDKSTESVKADDHSQLKPLNIENSSEREKSETTMREKTRFLDQIDNGNEANDLLDNAMNNQINNAVDTKDVGYIDILKIPSLKEVITSQISQDESSSDINSLTSVDQKTELIERLLKKAKATSRAKNEFPEISDDLENDEMELLNAISDLIKKPAEPLDQNSSHATRTRRSTENLEELLPRQMNDDTLDTEKKSSNKQHFPPICSHEKRNLGHEINISNDIPITNMSKEKVNSVHPANEKQTWKSNVLLYQLMNGKQTCGNGKLKVKTNDTRPIFRQKIKRLRREINTGEQEMKQRKKGKPIYKNFETNEKTKRKVHHLSDGRNVKKMISSDKSCRFQGKCKKRIHANKKHTIVSKKFHRYKQHGNDDKKMHNGPPSNDNTQQKGKISKDSTKYQRKANSSKTNQDVNDSYKMHGKYKKTIHKSRYSSNKHKKYGELSDNKDRNFHLENSNITKIEHGIQDGKETIATTRQSNNKTNVFNETSKNGFLNPSKSKKLGEEKRIDLDNKLNDYELDKGDDLDHFENHTPPINRVRTLSKDSSDAEYIDKMETRPDSSGYEKSTNHTHTEMKTFSKAVDDESADSERWIPPELQLEDDKSTESVKADDHSQLKPLNIENSSEREKSETTMREKTRFLDQIDNGNEANDLLDNAMNNQINNAVDTKDVGYIDILKIPSLKEVITSQISQDESSSDINSLTSVDQKTELIERLLKKAKATSRAKNEFPEISDDLENDEMELLNAISDLIKKPAEPLDQNSSHATRTRRSTENLEELLPRQMNDDTLDTEKKSSNKQHFPPICSHEKRNLGHEINISNDIPITNMSKEKVNSVHPANEKQTWKSNVLLYQLMNGKQTCGNGKLKVKTNDTRPIFRQKIKRLRREINTGEQEMKQRKKGKPIYKNFETNEKTKRKVHHLSDGRNVKKMISSDKSCRFQGKCKKRIHANKKHTIVSKKFHRYKQHGNDDKKMHNGPPSNDNTQQKGKISKDSTKYQRKANSSKTNQDVNDSYKMHGKYKKTIHKSRYSSNKHKKYGELSDNKDRNFHLENSNITKIEHGIQDGKETIATTRQSNNKTNVFNETSKNGFLNPSKSKKLGEEKRIDLDNKLNDYELDKGDDLDHFENHTPPINRVRTLSKDSSDAEYIDKMETRPDSSGYEKSTNHTHTEMKTFSKAVDDESADSERWIPPELQLEDDKSTESVKADDHSQLKPLNIENSSEREKSETTMREKTRFLDQIDNGNEANDLLDNAMNNQINNAVDTKDVGYIDILKIPSLKEVITSQISQDESSSNINSLTSVNEKSELIERLLKRAKATSRAKNEFPEIHDDLENDEMEMLDAISDLIKENTEPSNQTSSHATRTRRSTENLKELLPRIMNDETLHSENKSSNEQHFPTTRRYKKPKVVQEINISNDMSLYDESPDREKWIPSKLRLEDNKSKESVSSDDKNQIKSLNSVNNSQREKSETTMRQKISYNLYQIDNGNEANDLLDNAMSNEIINPDDIKDAGYIDILKIPSLKEVITRRTLQDESSSDINSLPSVDQKSELIERLIKKAKATSRTKNEFPEIHDDLEIIDSDTKNAISDGRNGNTYPHIYDSFHGFRQSRAIANSNKTAPNLHVFETKNTSNQISVTKSSSVHPKARALFEFFMDKDAFKNKKKWPDYDNKKNDLFISTKNSGDNNYLVDVLKTGVVDEEQDYGYIVRFSFKTNNKIIFVDDKEYPQANMEDPEDKSNHLMVKRDLPAIEKRSFEASATTNLENSSRDANSDDKMRHKTFEHSDEISSLSLPN